MYKTIFLKLYYVFFVCIVKLEKYFHGFFRFLKKKYRYMTIIYNLCVYIYVLFEVLSWIEVICVEYIAFFCVKYTSNKHDFRIFLSRFRQG